MRTKHLERKYCLTSWTESYFPVATAVIMLGTISSREQRTLWPQEIVPFRLDTLRFGAICGIEELWVKYSDFRRSCSYVNTTRATRDDDWSIYQF